MSTERPQPSGDARPRPGDRTCDHPSGASPLAVRVRQEVARARLQMDAAVLRGDRAVTACDGDELREALDEQREVIARTEARLAAVVARAIRHRDRGSDA